MNAMILAAGRGERLRPVTDSVPKAMVEVRGEHLIDRHIKMLANAGVSTIVINLGWLGEKISEHLGSGQQHGVQIVFSPEYDEVLETGGGILRALPVLGHEPFWVINADVYTDWQLPHSPLEEDASAELVLVPKPAHKANGDFNLVGGRINNDAERPYTYSGIARYRPEFFSGAKAGRFSVVPMMRSAADEGRLAGNVYAGGWEDVGTVDRLDKLNRR